MGCSTDLVLDPQPRYSCDHTNGADTFTYDGATASETEFIFNYPPTYNANEYICNLIATASIASNTFEVDFDSLFTELSDQYNYVDNQCCDWNPRLCCDILSIYDLGGTRLVYQAAGSTRE